MRRVTLAGVVAAAAVVGSLFGGCFLDDSNPPLKNEAPNREGPRSQPAASSGGVGGGPGDNCECVAALCAGGTEPCSQCFTEVLQGTACATELATCDTDGAGGASESCSDVRQCVATACDTTQAAREACFLPASSVGRTDYDALLSCVCAACGSACKSPGVACGGGAGGSTPGAGGSTATTTTLTAGGTAGAGP